LSSTDAPLAMLVAMIRIEHWPPLPGQKHRDSAKNGTSYSRVWLGGMLTRTFAPGTSTNVVDFVLVGRLLVRLSTRTWAPPESDVSTAAAVPVRATVARSAPITTATRLYMRCFIVVPLP
jgi:hypothetical protein